MKDVRDFMRDGVNGCADFSQWQAANRIGTIRLFKGIMKSGLHQDGNGTDNPKVISSGHEGVIRFHEGYENPVEPLFGNEEFMEWAEKRGKNPNAKTMHVSYKDDNFHRAEDFMRKSIPTEAEVKAELDRVIGQTLRGGTV